MLMADQTLREFYMPRDRVVPFEAMRKSGEINRYSGPAEHSQVTQVQERSKSQVVETPVREFCEKVKSGWLLNFNPRLKHIVDESSE